jgi:protein arginine kinase activator
MNACDQCGQGNATIQYTEVSRGEVSRVNLCRKCAASRGLLSESDEGGVEALISKVSQPSASRPEAASDRVKRCPTCEQSWEEFESTGVLGCEDCYRTFAMPLTRLLRETHHALLHHGSAGKRHASDPATLLPELRSLLDQAIREEDYEAAASLRDRIQHLESAAEEGPVGAETRAADADDDEDDESVSGEDGPSGKGV